MLDYMRENEMDLRTYGGAEIGWDRCHHVSHGRAEFRREATSAGIWEARWVGENPSMGMAHLCVGCLPLGWSKKGPRLEIGSGNLEVWVAS